ncbi:diphthine--ammonia ligase [archaeon]|nr:diphthine--ammonia ligase [archaeon]
MKLAVLFSGGKDSTYAAWLAKKQGHEISCLISIWSENEDSFMFHTPTIELTKIQAGAMKIPLIIQKTKGKKEIELKDLEKAIKNAKKEFGIEGVVTGAVESVYQASRVQKICNKLNLEVFNPLWQKDQVELLKDLVNEKFEIVVSSVAAWPLDEKFVGRKINKKFILEMKILAEKYKINPAGEGGEFESLVINCPLFRKKINLQLTEVTGEGNSWRGKYV